MSELKHYFLIYLDRSGLVCLWQFEKMLNGCLFKSG